MDLTVFVEFTIISNKLHQY